MNIISLNNDYTLNIDGYNPIKVDAPCSDVGALVKKGVIDNPLTAKNGEEVVLEISKKNCTFDGTFNITDDDLKSSNIALSIDCVDTLCKCYINDKPAFESNNAYVPIFADVKNLLVEGENKIRFEIESAVEYITKKQENHKLPKNNNGIDGAAYIRKSACHFGWDWGPCVPYKYIGNIQLECYEERIDNIVIKQDTCIERSNVIASADGAKSIYMLTPDGNRIDATDGKFIIDNPKLWYTRELSEKDTQPLYTVVFENDEMTVEKKIGLRKIELNTSADEYGTNFQIVLNGQRIFAKGANLIPFGAIPEDYDDSHVDYYLNLAIKSNFNMLRVWGGGEYSGEYLLSRCDELGILIWQDFQFACLMYPFYEDDFLANVLNEAAVNVKRMTLHPSVALWCGNNELEAMFSWMPKTSQIMKAYVEFFYHRLPEHIKDLTDIPYIATSPIGKKPFERNTADECGDTHMWNVWHGLKPLDYYKKRYTRFMSEFGLESLPSMKAIKTFAEEKDFDLTSDAFMSHQKCIGGNAKMLFYLQEKFDLPRHFEDLPYLTGIVQAECVKNATEHFRQHKGRCNGSLFWQFNDVWNCPSWSAVDFEGVPKALMYMAQEFCAPFTVSIDKGNIFAHNDTMTDKEADFEIIVYNGKNTKNTVHQAVKADSVIKIGHHKLKRGEALAVCFNGRTVIADRINKLKKANIDVKIKDNKMCLKTDTYTRGIFIDCDAELSDNYFSMLPDMTKEITFDGNIDDFKIKCENNIEFNRNPIKRHLGRFFYRLMPMNIANAFYYQFN